MIHSSHPTQNSDLSEVVWSVQSIFNIWRKDTLKCPAIVLRHQAEYIVAINGLGAGVMVLFNWGGTPGDLDGDRGEGWVDEAKKYKNDPHDLLLVTVAEL